MSGGEWRGEWGWQRGALIQVLTALEGLRHSGHFCGLRVSTLKLIPDFCFGDFLGPKCFCFLLFPQGTPQIPLS